MTLSLIVAAASNLVIGQDNKLPWSIPEDLKYFKNITLGKPIIMGRKTYESIGKALPGRTNIVISSDNSLDDDPHIIHADNPEEALRIAEQLHEETIVIGGSSLYEYYLPKAQRIYYTEVHRSYEGDAFFPTLDPRRWTEVSRKTLTGGTDHPSISFVVYNRTNTRPQE